MKILTTTAAAAYELVLAGLFLGPAVQAGAQESEAPQFDPAYSAGEVRSIAGGAAFYVARGEGEPVVFFMPRFDQRYWQFQLPALSQNRRAVALWTSIGGPLPPGVASPAPLRDGGPALPGFLATAFPATLEALRAELGVESLHLVTHSIGGRIALEAAAARPDLFATLTLLEPAGGIGTLPPPEPSCTLEAAEPVELEECVFVNLFSGPGYFEAMPEAMRLLLVEDRRANDAFLASLPAAAPVTNDPSDTTTVAQMFFPICEEIGSLPMPVLFVRGANSTAYFQSGLDYYEECLPAHETVVVEGAAHNAHIEKPAAFNAAVVDFLRQHPAQGRSR